MNNYSEEFFIRVKIKFNDTTKEILICAIYHVKILFKELTFYPACFSDKFVIKLKIFDTLIKSKRS